MKALAVLALSAAACSSAHAQSRRACTAADAAAVEREVAAVEADMFADGFIVCYGKHLEDCPEFADVRAAYKDRRLTAHLAREACK